MNPPRRYAAQVEIGRGAIGVVHREFDERLQRHVAVKMPHSDSEGAALEMFFEEARLTARLNHPNVVPVYDLELQPRPALRMRLVEGTSLTGWIDEAHRRPFDNPALREFALIFLKVCDAASYAHSQGVVHRDLNPDNVMVSRFGEVYVVDWSVAASVAAEGAGRASPRGAARRGRGGTPGFAAPEQFAEESAACDERVDVFGLGGILCYYLTGQAPYVGPHLAAVIKKTKAGRAISLSARAVWSTLPEALVRIAERALAPDPTERYPTVDALRQDVASFLDGGGLVETRQYHSGQTVVEEGMPGDEAFLVREGRCAVYRRVNGERRFVRHIGPGESFGELALLHGDGIRSASVVAEEPVTVCVITRSTLETEMRRVEWLRPLLRCLASRFRDLEAEAGVVPRPGPPLG